MAGKRQTAPHKPCILYTLDVQAVCIKCKIHVKFYPERVKLTSPKLGITRLDHPRNGIPKLETSSPGESDIRPVSLGPEIHLPYH